MAIRPVLAAVVLLVGCGGTPREQWRDPPGGVPTAQGVFPVPIGAGPRFSPPAGPTSEPCTAGPVQGRFRAHVELFARRQAVLIPAGIGLKAPRRDENNRIVAADCRARVRTLEPTGVVEFDERGLTVADLFAVWGQRLGDHRLLSFTGTVQAFVAGERVEQDPATLPLTDEAQIVIEIGGYVEPHASFAFPPRP
ncbi:hypothetical protein OJ997_19975 [Solirubrobacter phytolaccae]|uniref:Uncharacterized protein n=1 Tax=Solirubrobacter phytolaccae TaxID=1404360 RepID=A0A9X3S8T6_9ACTN|nr:hypothetical protein [Solirubrobacter phytolaccae]MDA0182599.1 hypothetical protein [Solirubrobacter phytolaccae]